MVIFRQIAEKISANYYKISSYKSCLFVKILLMIKWPIFNYFGNCDQIALAAAQSGYLSACLSGAAKIIYRGIPGQVVWFIRQAESGEIQLHT